MSIYLWLYSPLLCVGRFFRFFIFFTQSVGILGRVISPSQGLYLNIGQYKQHKRIHIPNKHALSGIQTHDPSVRTNEDSVCLRRLGSRDWLWGLVPRKYKSPDLRKEV
jgi:hypothetical protein